MNSPPYHLFANTWFILVIIFDSYSWLFLKQQYCCSSQTWKPYGHHVQPAQKLKTTIPDSLACQAWLSLPSLIQTVKTKKLAQLSLTSRDWNKATCVHLRCTWPLDQQIYKLANIWRYVPNLSAVLLALRPVTGYNFQIIFVCKIILCGHIELWLVGCLPR